MLFCQLEDLEVTISDHIQKVLKPNFAAAWEEVGDDFEKEETFALSSIKTLDGKMISSCLLVIHIVILVNLPCWGYIWCVGGEFGAFQWEVMSQQQGFVLQCWDYSEWNFGIALLKPGGGRGGFLGCADMAK